MRELKSEINSLNHYYELLIEKSELDRKLIEKLMMIRARVKMPGFRPGHAPIEIVAKNYGLSAKREAVVDLIKSNVSKLIASKNVRPTFQPDANIISETAEGIVISVKFESIPNFDLVEFKDLKINRYKVKITDKEIDDFLADVLDKHPNWVLQEKDYVASEGDKVVADIKLLSGSFKGKRDIKNVSVVLSGDEFVEPFWRNLIGVKANEEKTFQIKNENDDMKYRVKVYQIYKPKKFELDDEFAKFVGLESKDGIRNWAAEVLQKEYEPDTSDLIKKQLLDVLITMYDFDIPETMVKLEENEILMQIKSEAKKEGKTLSEKKMPSLIKECHDVAIRRVRLGLVIAKVAVEKKITVSSEELRTTISSIARLYPGRELEIMKQYMSNNGLLSAVAGPLLEEKVVKYIIDNYASVTDIELSKDEFKQLDTDYFDCYDDDEEPENNKGIRKLSAMQQKIDSSDSVELVGDSPIDPNITGLDAGEELTATFKTKGDKKKTSRVASASVEIPAEISNDTLVADKKIVATDEKPVEIDDAISVSKEKKTKTTRKTACKKNAATNKVEENVATPKKTRTTKTKKVASEETAATKKKTARQKKEG